LRNQKDFIPNPIPLREDSDRLKLLKCGLDTIDVTKLEITELANNQKYPFEFWENLVKEKKFLDKVFWLSLLGLFILWLVK